MSNTVDVTFFQRALKLINEDDPEYFEKMMELADMFIDLKESKAGEEVEDIREGPYSDVSLDDAVNKLMFELKNDPSLYKGYKDNLSRVIYDRIMKDSNFSDEEVPSIIEETIREITDDAAEDFLDEYISLIKE